MEEKKEEEKFDKYNIRLNKLLIDNTNMCYHGQSKGWI